MKRSRQGSAKVQEQAANKQRPPPRPPRPPPARWVLTGSVNSDAAAALKKLHDVSQTRSSGDDALGDCDHLTIAAADSRPCEGEVLPLPRSSSRSPAAPSAKDNEKPEENCWTTIGPDGYVVVPPVPVGLDVSDTALVEAKSTATSTRSVPTQSDSNLDADGYVDVGQGSLQERQDAPTQSDPNLDADGYVDVGQGSLQERQDAPTQSDPDLDVDGYVDVGHALSDSGVCAQKPQGLKTERKSKNRVKKSKSCEPLESASSTTLVINTRQPSSHHSVTTTGKQSVLSTAYVQMSGSQGLSSSGPRVPAVTVDSASETQSTITTPTHFDPDLDVDGYVDVGHALSDSGVCAQKPQGLKTERKSKKRVKSMSCELESASSTRLGINTRRPHSATTTGKPQNALSTKHIQTPRTPPMKPKRGPATLPRIRKTAPVRPPPPARKSPVTLEYDYVDFRTPRYVVNSKTGNRQRKECVHGALNEKHHVSGQLPSV